MRVDQSRCYPVTQTKLVNFINSKFLKLVNTKFLLTAINWPTLHYHAEPATTKCKPVAVLQLSSTLMTGQSRTNSHRLSSKFEPVQSR